MNTNSPHEHDPAFRAMLREWSVTEPLPPRFQAQVWKRIESAEALPVTRGSPWRLLMDWVNALLPRPAFALACATVLLLVGGAAGWAQARYEAAQVGGVLEARYLRVVDPYQPAD